MCLSIPGKITTIKKGKITVDYVQETREADMALVDIKVGDYVIVKEKIIITRVPEKEALSSIKLFKNARKKDE